jgi:hypothetical protein
MMPLGRLPVSEIGGRSRGRDRVNGPVPRLPLILPVRSLSRQ